MDPLSCLLADRQPLVYASEPSELLSLEGTIGAGKSLQFKKLKETYGHVPDVLFLEEPVDLWVANGLLQAFYHKTISPAVFQFSVLMSLVGPLISALRKKPRLIISERSPYSNYATFGQVNIHGSEQAAFSFTYSEIIKALPDVRVSMVLLGVRVDTAVERILARGRASEQSMPRAYLEALHEKHSQLGTVINPSLFVELDGECEPERVHSELCEIINGIFKYQVERARVCGLQKETGNLLQSNE